jgi:membrane-associated phospholipid phosphatase
MEAQRLAAGRGFISLKRGNEPKSRELAQEVRSSVRLFLAAVFLILSGVAALCVDCPLALWFSQGHGPIVLHQLSNLAEFFGRPEFVVLVAAAIYAFDRNRRWALPVVIGLALASGLAADVVKMLVARARPHHFDLAGSVWSTFCGWLPLTTAGSGGQSFPSGHTATAAGLALALVTLYPQARGVFLLLPIAVAYQRVDSGAHFLSDVLCGAAVACVVAALCVRSGIFRREAIEAATARMRARLWYGL